MSIIVNKRPYERCWTGNPIHYTLYSSAAEADATIYFEIKVLFKRSDAADFMEAIILPYKPYQGTAKVDVQDIIDGLLEYELPFTPETSEFSSALFASKMTGVFYIEYREITEADPDPDWDESDSGEQIFVIKGGISFEKWRGNNYWVNYFDNAKPFLTWAKNNALHALNERMYLAWLNRTTVDLGMIKMQRTVRFTDGTEDIETYDCPVPYNQVLYFPTGAAQLELEAIDTSKTIYWWEMQVFKVDTNPQEPLSEAFRYYADFRHDYNDITLNYRNSLGGLDSVRIKGVIDYTAQREFTQSERVVVNDYFSGHYINGRVIADNSQEILLYKGDIGHLGKEEQDRLRDIHFKRECWWEQDLKWLPVMLLTQTQRVRFSKDKIFTMPIEFCIATGGDFYYTPKNVNLAEEAPAVGLVCTAVINTLASLYVPGTGWQISWVLASGSPAKYFVSTPAVSGGAPGETTTLGYTFPWLPPGDNVVTVQPLCFIGGVYYFGTAQTLTVTVPEACVPVGISSSPIYLPDAIENVAYSFVMNLTGTAPFSIGSIVNPTWMTVAVVGSTVTFTGTPGIGDAATDIDVSFTLSNCSGGSTQEYVDTIDVMAGAANGDFLLTNTATGSNFIRNVHTGSTPFFTIVTGTLPCPAGEITTGFLTQAVPGSISVYVVLSSTIYWLKLYKNAVLQQAFAVPGTGTYSFSAAGFLISDDMEIKLTLP
jgi:hypothetical protein